MATTLSDPEQEERRSLDNAVPPSDEGRAKEGGDEQAGVPESHPDVLDRHFAAPDAKKAVYPTSGSEPSNERGEPLDSSAEVKDGKKNVPDRETLADQEETPGSSSGAGSSTSQAQHENQVGRGWIADDDPKSRKKQKWSIRNRKKIIGGGVIGTILGTVLAFTIFSGPLQFVHISELMQQFHFASQQNTQDDRFMHEVRWLRYSSKDVAQRSRMGYLGNKFTDPFEGKMKASGLIPRYDKTFGLFIGYEIDTESKDSPYHGKTKEEAIKAASADTGIEAISYDGKLNNDLKGKPIIEMPKGITGYFKSQLFDYSVLKENGLRGLPAAIGARLMATRRGATLHPINKLITKGEESLSALTERVKQNRDNAIRDGAKPDLTSLSASDTNSNDPGAANAADAANATNDTIAESQNPTTDTTQEGSKISLKAAAAGGSLFAVGIACTLRHIDSQAADIKDAQVVAPLIRMGTEAVALGEQVKSGQDIDLQTLGIYANQLNGYGSGGKKSSWIDSAPIQTELGNPGKGVDPPPTYKTATTNNSPFHALNTGHVGSVLGNVCTGAIGFVLNAAGLVGAGLVDIVSAGIQGYVINQFAGDAARWIAGKAVDPDVVGADDGAAIDYGNRLAANDEAIGGGGRQLSDGEEGQLTDMVNTETTNQFNNHSLAYKLFDPYDSKSTISKLIDQTSPSFSQNIAKMGSALFNFGHLFSSIGSMFSGSAHAAAATTYDYGFPAYGFSTDELSRPEFENPFENACYVVGCPDKNISGFLVDGNNNFTDAATKKDGYLDRAKNCFGVNIGQNITYVNGTSLKQVAVTGTTSPTYAMLQDATNNCNEPAPADCTNDTSEGCDWLRLRFFIMDAETMNAMACYAGGSSDQDANQACSDTGFGGSAISTTSGSSSATSGSGSTQNAQQLARQIQSNKNVVLAGGEVPSDIDAAANGKSGSAGAMTSSAILQFILAAGQNHSIVISAIQSGGDHHCLQNGVATRKAQCPTDPHYNGDAVDIAVIDGVDSSGRDENSDKLITLAETILPSGSGFGQQNCATGGNQPVTLQAGFIQFDDFCNHLHVEVPKGTP